MKKTSLIAVSVLLMAAAAVAQTKSNADAILDQMVPQCTGTKLTQSEMKGQMPAGMTAQNFSLESNDPYCRFDAVRVALPDGRFFVGQPWPIGVMKGQPAEKIRDFAYQNLHLTFAVEPAGMDGAYQKLKVFMVTEAGKIPVDGYVDSQGTMFFMGDFVKSADDLLAKRNARLAPVLAKAPNMGPKDAPVTLIEFSDFQCPSCKEAHSFVKPLLEKYPGKIHYSRIDMPLISAHPWAFYAAVMGRAIWRQSPDAFWEWKSAVYDSQADLNAFLIEDFGRNFAKDHSLDVAKYEADVASEELRKEILDGVGAAFTMQIQATPSYIVNGRLVASGKGGHNLAAYIDDLLAAKK